MLNSRINQERRFRIKSFHPMTYVPEPKKETMHGGGAPRFYFRSFFVRFRLSDLACNWYKTRTYIRSRMNAPWLGSIIEVKSQPSDIEPQDDTRPPHEMKTAIYPFGSVLLRLELVLSVICAGRRRACPVEVEGRIRPIG